MELVFDVIKVFSLVVSISFDVEFMNVVRISVILILFVNME